MRLQPLLGLLLVAGSCSAQLAFGFNKYSFDSGVTEYPHDEKRATKDAFIDALLNKMTTGGAHFISCSPTTWLDQTRTTACTVSASSTIGTPPTKSQYNSLQKLNIDKSRLKIPFMQTGECLHGVGSFKQSMFPQSIGIAASFDQGLAYSVGRAIGSEASSIGIHACFSPVLDLGKEPRWGRVQEAWGEDFVLTSHMGVAYARGLSKNGRKRSLNARGGLNAAPFIGRGYRQVMQEMLVPFKAVMDLGGARGVMMSYNELDEVPAVVHPDYIKPSMTGAMEYLLTRHTVADSPADTIQQWFNAGGGLQFYDFTIDIYMNTTVDLVANHTVSKNTLKGSRSPHPQHQVRSRTLRRSVYPRLASSLLENRNNTLPIKPADQGIKTIALVGPFSDILNYGDYAGPWVDARLPSANASDVQLVSSWGTNTWLYNGQYNIPGYPPLHTRWRVRRAPSRHTTPTQTFTDAEFTRQETPNRDWGLYPPVGLPSNNFSVRWEGTVTVPVDRDVSGWIGVGVNANTSATLYIDDAVISESPATLSGNIIGNIEQLSYDVLNGTGPPPGASAFIFAKGATHKIRVDYQAFNYVQKFENVNSLNAQIELFWNLVDTKDPIGQAVDVAKSADLSRPRSELADALFALGKPVVMVLQGGRPFALPRYYANAAAVIDACPRLNPSPVVLSLGNLAARQSRTCYSASSIQEHECHSAYRTMLGPFQHTTRLGLTISLASYKFTAHAKNYTDLYSFPTYSFGYGKSFSTFTVTGFNATTAHGNSERFSAGDTYQLPRYSQERGTSMQAAT
ncbi:glycoside hydrolase family 3 protein [Mycena amicta]|nr:glycoside hydrolase family 3 protein [Mycena amicta]